MCVLNEMREAILNNDAYCGGRRNKYFAFLDSRQKHEKSCWCLMDATN